MTASEDLSSTLVEICDTLHQLRRKIAQRGQCTTIAEVDVVLHCFDDTQSPSPEALAQDWRKAHRLAAMSEQYLDHQLECPYCLTIRLRIPGDARAETSISCDDCGEYLGTWDELQADFERQGGQDGVFRLDKGRIRRID